MMMSLPCVLVFVTALTAGNEAVRALPQEEEALELYERALEHIETKEYQKARTLLEEAVSIRPSPAHQLPSDGLRYLDYLPYLFLGVVAAELGEEERASQYLDVSTSYGAVIQSQAGHPILKRYRLKLANADVLATPRDADRGLSEAEFEEVHEAVVERCGLGPMKGEGSFPWYFYYELGLEMLKRDDPIRALESFLSSLDRKEEPQRRARIYGMWYTSYAPYYRIGLAHYEMGNYACMRDAFDTSRALAELDPNGEDYRERERLRLEAEKSERR
jgi:tetratricopeptide (TPR) repeat protein